MRIIYRSLERRTPLAPEYLSAPITPDQIRDETMADSNGWAAFGLIFLISTPLISRYFPVFVLDTVSAWLEKLRRIDQMIHDGVVTDQAEVARLGRVTRARLTQIMNLICLAADIQERVLFLPVTKRGHDAIAERHLRPIAGVPDWRKQQRMWEDL